MLLEKIKEHAGKLMFFAVNILVVATGVMFIKQKNIEQTNTSSSEADAQNFKEAADYALKVQQGIDAQKEAKIVSDKNAADAAAAKNNEAAAAQTVPTDTLKIPSVSPAAVVTPPIKINGKCGTADSSADRKNSKCDGKSPSANLCSAGSASVITAKPNKYDQGWNWKCEGKNGGTSATCRCS